MSKRKTLHMSPPSSSSSSQPITALSQRQGLLDRLRMLKTRQSSLQKNPQPGAELEKVLEAIASIENLLKIQEEKTDSKPRQLIHKKPRLVDEKTSELPLPLDLWVHTASFLTLTSLANLTRVSKFFLTVDWEDARRIYQKERMDFSKLDTQDPLAEVKPWSLFKKIPQQSRLFSTPTSVIRRMSVNQFLQKITGIRHILMHEIGLYASV